MKKWDLSGKTAVTANVADFASVQASVDQAIAHFGSLDIYIGNAGAIDPIGLLAEADPDAWGANIDTNLKGVMYGMRAAMTPMLAQGAGTIITTSSGAAHGPVEGWSAYCSGKAGAYMLTRVADHENRDKGLRIMGLSPGTVATQMQRDIKASGINPVSQLEWTDHIPPEWPAQALVWMCTADADDHTGVGKVFSAGADLDAARAGLATSPLWEELSGAIARSPAMTVAALNGTLAGGACGMALACDIRIAADHAKFFYPVSKRCSSLLVTPFAR